VGGWVSTTARSAWRTRRCCRTPRGTGELWRAWRRRRAFQTQSLRRGSSSTVRCSTALVYVINLKYWSEKIVVADENSLLSCSRVKILYYICMAAILKIQLSGRVWSTYSLKWFSGAVPRVSDVIFPMLLTVWGWPSWFWQLDTTGSIRKTTSALLTPRCKRLKATSLMSNSQNSPMNPDRHTGNRSETPPLAMSHQFGKRSKTIGQTSPDPVVLRMIMHNVTVETLWCIFRLHYNMLPWWRQKTESSYAVHNWGLIFQFNQTAQIFMVSKLGWR